MEQRRVISVVAAAAVVAAGAAVIAVNWTGGAPREAAAQAAPPPVKAKLRTVDLVPADPRATGLDLPERGTETFSMLGITWTDAAAVPAGTVQVRTRAVGTGSWSAWRLLDTGDTQGPDTGAERAGRGGTDPLWVGPSNGVAARIVSATGTAARVLPAGLRLDLIDPSDPGGQGGGGEEPSDAPTPDAPEPTPTDEPTTASPNTEPTTTGPTTAAPDTTAPATAGPTTAGPVPSASPKPAMGPLPPYVSRAAWKADESIVTGTTSYAGDVKVLFVHHTAGSNDYSCADSPAIVRGILTYHVQSRGWNDIGYNFLVDKCGTLFEGRRGGVDKAVIGAHTYGFNTNSAAIAVLGTYIKDPVPPVTQTVIAQVAAHKLGRYGYDPSTTARLTEGAPDGKFKQGQVVTFQRISGHRDAVATECPGDALYAQLAAIRTDAASVVYGFTVKPVSGYVRGSATLTWSVGTPTGLLGRFELVVDGRTVGSVPASARSAPVKLADGTHKLAVRAVHADNTTLIAGAGTVVSDATAPVFTRAPEVTLRGGTVSASSVPVTLGWKAADTIRLSSVAVTTPVVRTFPATTTGYATSAAGAARTWRMTARDAAGNTAAASATRTPVIVAETSAKRSGRWAARSGSSYLGGRALTSSTRNAKLTFTFTGRSAALVVSRGTASGKVDVYVDGKRVGTVDLRASRTAYRQAVWVRSFTGSARHTVMINVLGTGGRPAVTVDALVYVR